MRLSATTTTTATDIATFKTTEMRLHGTWKDASLSHNQNNNKKNNNNITTTTVSQFAVGRTWKDASLSVS
jgi:hypothetical protein